ncbi:hypothetical protein [Streptomyces sp. NBC_01443]|uniref:hypothetical protein n=1 Tax=Streptomyces sp. NBC_01443 TaxID=2903868 RepID=UPI0022543B2C|nr:hypothetical protein [Streptomyces sp. NBC_01443]MCX4629182.1 hypothetical protein [Streptomyces sp. NBC_01443]
MIGDAAAEWGFELGWKLRGLEHALLGGGWKRPGTGLSVRVRCEEGDGVWTAVGDDGQRRESRTAGTEAEAAALVREAFGVKRGQPQQPVPGVQRFTLIHWPVGEGARFADARYDGLKAQPPEGCTVEEIGGHFGLRCERPGPRLLDAVADLCGEIRTGHGLLMTDLGIEKLWEWSADGTDGWGAEIVGQLLLMAAERAPRLGYSVEDLVRFLSAAAGAEPAPYVA